MNVRARLLKHAYKFFRFSVRGDALLDNVNSDIEVSCIINFYGRPNILRCILTGLSEQIISKEKYEVILVEDWGGTKEGEELYNEFKGNLNIRYYEIEVNHGRMGYSRNFGLTRALGKIILFLDDDTIILQRDFLSTLMEEFEISGADAVIPKGHASYCLIKGKYSYHENYFPSNRCMAYKKETLRGLGGFISDMIGQEDVELLVRLIVSDKKIHKSEKLYYLHPPLILDSLDKAKAVGISFARIKSKYPLFIWLMLLVNGSRYLPLLLVPFNKKLRTQGRFSLGFMIGVLYSFAGKKIGYKEKT